jgi:cysteine desulfurase/selenocysteine lyase
VTGTDLPIDLRQLESLSAIAAGLPDPAVLAQLANEMFKGLPASADAGTLANPRMPVDVDPRSLTLAPPALTVPVIPPAVAPSLLPPSLDSIIQPSVPGISSSGALAHAGAPAGAVPVPGVTIPTPGIPGGFSAANYATLPSFSFLDEARSIYASPPAAPVHAVPIPTDSPERFFGGSSHAQLPSSLGGAKPPVIPVDVPGVSTPQTLGATTRPIGFDPGISFNFLEEIKPLDPINAVPTVMPVGSELLQQPQSTSFAAAPFDVQAIRRDFPILQERVNGQPLIWLDNAATTQKPQAVIDRLSYFYAHENSNVHRAAHTLAARATDAYENARKTTARFLSAPGPENIIFVRGATEAINLVAQSWGRRNVQKDDEIVITWLEHHANIVPWQMLCSEKGARLRVAPVDNSGQVLLDEYEKLLNPRTKIVSIAHVSNALGTIVPVTQMTEMAHRHGARVLVDGAQAVSHMPVDVQMIDCDFYVFSGHKVFAPTGIGVVYGKQDVLENMPPWQGGGNMIADVTFEKTLYQPPPLRFEAGTGNIADAVGLGAALDYVQRIGMHNIARYEHDLLVYGTESLARIPGLHLIGTAREKASVMSFVLDGYDTEDVGKALASQGIAVRAGHHCAQPILRRFGVERTVRPSLAFYNTCEEIDALVAAVWNLKSGRNPGLR